MFAFTCLYYTLTYTAHIYLLYKGSHVHSLTMKYDTICRVTNCSPNPDEIGYGPNEPNTINL